MMDFWSGGLQQESILDFHSHFSINYWKRDFEKGDLWREITRGELQRMFLWNSSLFIILILIKVDLCAQLTLDHFTHISASTLAWSGMYFIFKGRLRSVSKACRSGRSFGNPFFVTPFGCTVTVALTPKTPFFALARVICKPSGVMAILDWTTCPSPII